MDPTKPGAETETNFDENRERLRKTIESIRKMSEMLSTMKILPGLVPERIWRSGDVTRVLWKDGVTTTVKLAKDDSGLDSAYVAFCIALGKRLYGTNSALHRVVDTHLNGYLEDREREQRKKEADKHRLENERAHRKRVQRLAKRMRLEAEAKRYNEALRKKDEDLKGWYE